MSHLPCLHALSTLSTYLSTALPASDHTLANQIALTFPLLQNDRPAVQNHNALTPLHFLSKLSFSLLVFLIPFFSSFYGNFIMFSYCLVLLSKNVCRHLHLFRSPFLKAVSH